MSGECTTPDGNADLGRLVIEIYDAALGRRWGKVLEQCNTLFQSNKAFMILRDVATESIISFKIKSCVPLPESAIDFYLKNFMTDPVFQLVQTKLEGEYVNTTYAAASTQPYHDAFCKKVTEPVASDKTLVSVVLKDENYEGFFGVSRSSGELPFSDRETSLLERLMPHLIRASRFFRDEELFKRDRDIAQNVYEYIQSPFAVCDRQLNVLAANSGAKYYLKNSDCIHMKGNKLVLSTPRVFNQLLALVNSAYEHPQESNVEKNLVADESLTAILLLKVSYLCAKNDARGEEPVFFISFVIKPAPDWKKVQDGFELTKRETLIARFLYKEADIEDIANAINVCPSQAKEWVKLLLDKMVVADTGELTELIMAFPYKNPLPD
ncbi:hypothetical protein [Aestuariibacter sp. A3R04]|uniref:hypothetical protein n=1 Tax=Aestuariibacter sp. A3R04 TaxID=2841571 RepID=UPI001C0A4B7C|nr:hypothetical protein [Aestuariibacter sp. A3R04]MBU3023677.1 hypothetical protein [Aestuariibacter sp. A3R04]